MQSETPRKDAQLFGGLWRRAARSGPSALAACAIALALVSQGAAQPRSRTNGFSVEPSDVPASEILYGGVARDAIPALDHPSHAGADTSWSPMERVIGVSSNGQARAYPVSLLVWHELVNDTLGGRPLLVSYCPLCGTGIVFDRRVDEAPPRRFGVSGLLYRSDLLMYDHKSESLWSQISARALSGPARGMRLRLIRSVMTTWGQWREAHPETTVLTRDTGYARRYGHSPYGSYPKSRELIFPVPFARRYHPKMPTLGLRLADGTARAYPSEELEAAGGVMEERFGGHAVRVAWDSDSETFAVDAPEPVEVIEGYWFAWSTFHPDTSVATSGKAE